MVNFIETPDLKNPTLIATWPGMGMVAFNAVSYLKNKLGAKLFGTIEPDEFFAATSANVEKQIIKPVKKPDNKFYFYKSPNGNKDIVFFIGNLQPIPHLEYRFAKLILESTKPFGVKRVLTGAAAPSDMDPGTAPRVFAAPNSYDLLRQLVDLNVHFMGDGTISGLNGLLISVAREMGIDGVCLLGEIPFFTAQIEFPRASIEVLKILTSILNVSVDLVDLELYAETKEKEISALASHLSRDSIDEEKEHSSDHVLPGTEDKVDRAVRNNIEKLFRQAEFDQTYKSKMRLKEELDRWDLFDEYLDRFLDLFKKSKDKG